MSLREALEAGYEAIDTGTATEALEPVESTSTVPLEQQEAPVEAVEEPAQEAAGSPAEGDSRARDGKGRFAPKTEAAPAAKAPPKPAAPLTVSPGPAKPVSQPLAAVAPSVRPPQSWTLAEREAFLQAPKAVQDAALRREAEFSRAFEESAGARRFQAQAQETLRPFETLARANGQDVMAYAGNVLQTAAVLQMGHPQQIAGVLATLVRQQVGKYGPQFVEQIATMLDQAPQQQGPQGYQPPVDMNAQVERVIQQRVEAATQARAQRDAAAFQATNPEFLEDVRAEMQMILHGAAQAGRAMTYQQAYDRACKMNDDVTKILEQRKAASAAATANAATQRTRAAASGIRSTPATAGGREQPKTLNGVLSEKYDEIASGGR